MANVLQGFAEGVATHMRELARASSSLSAKQLAALQASAQNAELQAECSSHARARCIVLCFVDSYGERECVLL